MNKIYEQQLNLNRFKINESSGRPWKRKAMSQPSIPVGNPVLKKSKPEQELPQEQPSELSNYTGADLAWDAASLEPTGIVSAANAVRYAAKGDLLGAGLSALGAIPVVGKAANLVKVAKTGTGLVKAAKTGTAITKVAKEIPTARRIIPKAADVIEIKPTVSKPLANISKTAKVATGAAAAGAAAGTGASVAKDYLKKKLKDEDEDDSKKNSIQLDPIPSIGLDIHRLGAFEAGEPSPYSKSVVVSRRGGDSPLGYNPYFTAPVNIELERRRSYYSQRKGLPESFNSDNIKYKIKKSVNNYLKSREGQDLNKHLNSVKNNIEKY
jgi:hypothetical protein